ncbi:MAG: beta-lactamase family protein [Planctomycetes bacterium]|nr:beta-lactamase family protein [Planctomycetota bacterium]MCB9903703.1 beta-lactamase family protein [Planctomycetota bacterium]
MTQFTALLASSFVGLALAAAPPVTPEDGLREAAEALCQQAWEPGAWDAAAVVIAVGDEPIFTSSRGKRAERSKEMATADASLAASSMAHAFLSALVVQSCARGDFALDDELGKLIPDLVGEDCHVHVRHLLAHTSGFVDCGAQDPLDGASDDVLWKRLQEVVKQPLVTSPGECVAPTTTDTLLLAATLERIDKRPIEEILAKRLFEPLEMGSSRCVVEDPSAEVREASSDIVQERAVRFDPRWIETSVLDLVRFQRALIDHDLFSEEDYLEMISPTRLNDGTHSAFGMGLRQIRIGGIHGVRAGGVDGDVSATLAFLPEYDLTVSVIGRGDDLDAESLLSDLAMLVIAPPEAPIVDLLLEPAEMKPYLGTYQIGCTSLIIRAGEGRLVLDDAVAGEMTLLNQGDHYFVVESDRDMTLKFELVEDHAVSFVLDDHGVETVATRFEKGAVR